MKTIHKFPIEITDEQVVQMPAGARVLTAQVQPVPGDLDSTLGGPVCLWALVENDNAMVPRRVSVRGTGHPMADKRGAGPDAEDYVGTVQGNGLVFHVFVRPQV